MFERTKPTYDHMKRRISSQFSATTIASFESVAVPLDHGASCDGWRRTSPRTASAARVENTIASSSEFDASRFAPWSLVFVFLLFVLCSCLVVVFLLSVLF